MDTANENHFYAGLSDGLILECIIIIPDMIIIIIPDMIIIIIPDMTHQCQPGAVYGTLTMRTISTRDFRTVSL